MSANELRNALKRDAAAMDQQGGQGGWGTVVSYDGSKHLVKMQLQPSGVVTGWLPLLVPSVNGGGLYAPPALGDQGFAVPDRGDAQHLVVMGFANNTQAPVPQARAAVAGSPVALKAGGGAMYVSPSGAVLRFNDDGTVFIGGDLRVDGEIYDRHGSLDRLRGNYDRHTHHDSRGGLTDTPTPQDPE